MSLNVNTDNLSRTNDEVNTEVIGNEYSANGTIFDYNFNSFEHFFSQFQFQFTFFLRKYFSFVLFNISFFGNLIIVLVLLQKRSRYFSTSVYIISLAVSDFCTSLSLLEGWLLHNNFVEPTYSDLDCKLRPLISKAARYVSTWMLVVISIERALSVKVPLTVKTICTLKFARCFVILVWGFAFAKAFLNASIIVMRVVNDRKDCYINLPVYQNVYSVDVVLYTLFSVVIPYPIILVCSVMTVTILLQKPLRKSKSNKSQVRSITITLLFVNLVYFISETPAIVLEIRTLLWIYFDGPVEFTFESYNYYVNLLNILNFLQYFHHAVNIFIYFLSGSRFRKETKDLLYSCFCRKTG